MQETMSAPVSARAAAARCGLSERTLRRWIAAGLLHADKQGGTFLVSLEDVRTLVVKRRGHAVDSAAAEDVSAAPHTELSDVADNPAADTLRHDAPNVAALVDLVARLHTEVSEAKDEVREYATAAAMWQERARILEERLALAAPAERPVAARETPEPSDSTTETRIAHLRVLAPWLLAVLAIVAVIALLMAGIPLTMPR
jgi:hypothetical protein